MKRTVLTVAALALSGAVIAAAAPKANPTFARNEAQNQSNPQPKIQTFTGTITKTGDQFMFSDDSTKTSYQLDDQKTASRFDGQKVRVTGTLDAANNLIRVQSIEPASA